MARTSNACRTTHFGSSSPADPSISSEAQIALTLRQLCGLATEEIARAFLTQTSTVAQRIVRAKAKIRTAGIPYEVPGSEDLPGRLGVVLQVIYLVFNEGCYASSGTSLTRGEVELASMSEPSWVGGRFCAADGCIRPAQLWERSLRASSSGLPV